MVLTRMGMKAQTETAGASPGLDGGKNHGVGSLGQSGYDELALDDAHHDEVRVCVCDGVAKVVPLPHRRWPRPVHP